MPHSGLHKIKIIPVFGVLALCTIRIYHIRARAIDHSVLLKNESNNKKKGHGQSWGAHFWSILVHRAFKKREKGSGKW